MLLHTAFLVVAAANGGMNLPPRPDFVAMVPRTSGGFSVIACVRDACNPDRREAAALAGYFNRIWDHVAFADEPSDALALLTVAQQLDAALMNLNPNPTLGEAIERVRAYKPILALVQRAVEREEADPKPVAPGQLNQLSAQFRRFKKRIKEQYHPVFARAV
jgi:hypothetical protein